MEHETEENANMNKQEAIQLIERAAIAQGRPQQWADLGCGSGTFTSALAQLLPAGSIIHAVDRHLQELPKMINEVEIGFWQRDFERDDLPFNHLDGILLANALHYCKDATAVLKKLIQLQRAGTEQFLIIEYDTSAANRWIPYPLSFEKMKNIFTALGLYNVLKLGEHPSMFRKENMYACQAVNTFK